MTKQRRQKSLQELTIKDNFMFGAVMSDEANCKECLELILEKPIERITVCREKSILYHPGYKGVRLDVIAMDEKRTHYDVEMQVASKPALGKRSRYYHSQLDMEMLEAGESYNDLADAYVIFICDYDPFGKGLYRYSWKMGCRKVPGLELNEGRHTIILNTKGSNDDNVPAELVKFLKYVGANLEESTQDYEDPYVSKLQNSIANIKENRGMEAKYMLWKELLQDERKEGHEEGLKEGLNVTISIIIEMLSDLDTNIPDALRDTLQNIDNAELLKECSRKARNVATIEEFQE